MKRLKDITFILLYVAPLLLMLGTVVWLTKGEIHPFNEG